VLAALGAALTLSGCRPEAPAQANLLLITIDTLRADRLACYGGPPDVGAEICRLAERGVRYRWAFSSAPYTAPAVASILTSQYMSYHGVSQSALSFLGQDVLTLAEVLRDAGYTTAAFVSNPVLDKMRKLDQGFDVYDQRMTRRERNRPFYVEREAKSTSDAALAWAQVAAREPWFVWLHYQDPHGPYEPPDAASARDDPGSPALPVLENDSGRGGIPAYQALPGLFTKPAYQRRYLDEIRYLEAHLKRLIEGLDALGDPPAVILTSDHGEAFTEDGYYFAHGHSVGLDQIRVPLLLRPREPGKARVVDEPVSVIDVAPTLLRIAGLPAPDSFQGRPLPDGGGGGEARRAIYAEHSHRAAVIRGNTYYARDRLRLKEPTPDPNSMGLLAPLPRRRAQLSGDGPLPAYETGAVPGEFEPLLRRFLRDTRSLRAGPRHESIPEEMRQRLRALGYAR
jgi:arylsulfatase A-like enzyme